MADTIAIENAVRGLVDSGKRIEQHRKAVEAMESRPMAERIAALPSLTVRYFPYRPKMNTGNILWAERDRGSDYYRVSKFAMRGGTFPPSHPVGGTHSETDRSQMGSGPKIEAFRARGYWASCFPEGDGITFTFEGERSDEQVINDIQECFGWKVERAR